MRCHCGGGVGSTGEIDGPSTYRDTILAIIDASAIGEDVDVCAFGTELAITLCEVFADGLGGGTEVMAKGTGIAGLASALTEELAGNVRGIRRASGSIEAGSGRHGTRLASVGDVQTAAPSVTAFAIFGHDGGRREHNVRGGISRAGRQRQGANRWRNGLEGRGKKGKMEERREREAERGLRAFGAKRRRSGRQKNGGGMSGGPRRSWKGSRLELVVFERQNIVFERRIY